MPLEEINQIRNIPTNAISHMKYVQDITFEADLSLKQFLRLIEEFKNQLLSMKNKIQSDTDFLEQTTKPVMEALRKTFESSLQAQKEENSNFGNQIQELKKENKMCKNLIQGETKRIEWLMEEIGDY